MKILLLYSFCFLLIGCQTNSKSDHTEIINTEVITDSEVISTDEVIEIHSPEVDMLAYLTDRFDILQDTVFINKPDWMISESTEDIICGYILLFEEGHSFKHEQECVEWGEIITVNFKDYSIEEVRWIVEELFKNENYAWYENNTEYRPERYYESLWTFRITEYSDFIELDFAYSWI